MASAGPLYSLSLHEDFLDDGVPEVSYTYDAYGKQTGHTGTSTSGLGYTGNLTDASTGLVYLRARDYDPTTAQFLSIDPELQATGQPYAYCANDPLLRLDPSGDVWWNPGTWTSSTWDTIGQVAAVVGIVAGAAALCAATACIGDIAVLAGATTLTATLLAAETVSTVAETVGAIAAITSIGSGAVSTGLKCSGPGWRTPQCTAQFIGTGVDVLTLGVGRYVPWDSIAQPLLGFGSSIFDVGYQNVPWGTDGEYGGNYPC